MSVKAVHIELVSDMTTASFIAALKRFVSRRGIPDQIHSDNGSNFIAQLSLALLKQGQTPYDYRQSRKSIEQK